MKRNLLPLLGIAFVVALAASGIFYGVFVGQLKSASKGAVGQKIVVAARMLDRGAVMKPEDVRLMNWPGPLPGGSHQKLEEAVGKTLYGAIEENEPVTDFRLTAGKAVGVLGISKGMRALSIKVFDSAGLIPFLRAGHRVDVQVVQGRNNPEAALRTILQNVEVLSVQPAEGPQAAFAPSTIAVLAAPEDADRLALADSGASIRILLRNPLDDEQGARQSMGLASLFYQAERRVPLMVRASNPYQSTQPSAAPPPGPIAAAPEDRVEILVRVLAADAQTLAGLQLGDSGQGLQVLPLPGRETPDRLVALLQQKKGVELASARVTASPLRPASARPGKQWNSGPGGACGISIRFEPKSFKEKSFRLRVQPELSLPDGQQAVSTRRVVSDLDLSDGQGVVVTGWGNSDLSDRLFGKADAGVLVVILAPRILPAKTASAKTTLAKR